MTLPAPINNFLLNICQEPDDDDLRLIFADFLDDSYPQYTSWAHLIRGQIADPSYHPHYNSLSLNWLNEYMGCNWAYFGERSHNRCLILEGLQGRIALRKGLPFSLRVRLQAWSDYHFWQKIPSVFPLVDLFWNSLYIPNYVTNDIVSSLPLSLQVLRMEDYHRTYQAREYLQNRLRGHHFRVEV